MEFWWLVVFVSVVAASEVYISPFGSDSAAGTEQDPLLTLSAALSAVEGTDGIIYCEAGAYAGDSNVGLTIPGVVSIKAAPGALKGSVAFTGAGLTDAVIFTIGTGAQVVLQDLVFSDSYIALSWNGSLSSTTVDGCNFTENDYAVYAEGTNAGALYISNSIFVASTIFSSSNPNAMEVTDTQFQGGYVGIRLESATCTLSNSVFFWHDDYSVAAYEGSTFQAYNASFTNNTDTVFSFGESSAYIEDCKITNNVMSSSYYSVFYLQTDAVVEIANSTLAYNSAQNGMCGTYGTVDILSKNNVFYGNEGTSDDLDCMQLYY